MELDVQNVYLTCSIFHQGYKRFIKRLLMELEVCYVQHKFIINIVKRRVLTVATKFPAQCFTIEQYLLTPSSRYYIVLYMMHRRVKRTDIAIDFSKFEISRMHCM